MAKNWRAVTESKVMDSRQGGKCPAEVGIEAEQHLPRHCACFPDVNGSWNLALAWSAPPLAAPGSSR